jgi:hypothetical protein
MIDSVQQLRARWTPELTAAAIAFLQGNPSDVEIPTMEHDGRTYLDLRGIRIEGTQLDGMTIRNVNLRWATIRDVGFKGAKLVDCNLSQTQFAECYFRRTVFQKCDIVNAHFEESDFSNARIDQCRLDFATFKECEISLQSIQFRDDAPPQVLARVCRNLKLNALQMGRFGDAGELTYLEQTYERRVLYREALAGGRAAAIPRWLASLLLNWLWGYGEKPARLAIAIAVNIFAFGTVHYWLNALPDKAWWEHIYFSGITYLTIGYGDLSPVGAPARVLAVIEGMAGIATLGMLIASWTKKIMYR